MYGKVVVLNCTVCPLVKFLDPANDPPDPIKLPAPDVDIVVGISIPLHVPIVKSRRVEGSKLENDVVQPFDGVLSLRADTVIVELVLPPALEAVSVYVLWAGLVPSAFDCGKLVILLEFVPSL